MMPGADHGDDQEAGAERLGREAAGEVESQPTGAGLGLERQLASVGCSVVGHAAPRSSPSTDSMRSRSSATAASNARRGCRRDRVGDRPVQPVGRPGELLVRPVAHGDDEVGHARRRRAPRAAPARDRARPAGRRDRAGVDLRRRGGFPPTMPALPVRRSPERRGQLAAGRVRAADEQRPRPRRGVTRGSEPREGVPDAGGRTGVDRRRSTASARSARPPRARRGGGRAGSTRDRTDAAARSERGPTSRARRRSPNGSGRSMRACRAARTAMDPSTPGLFHSISIESSQVRSLLPQEECRSCSPSVHLRE